ncbi:MAG: peptidase E, partial [Pseudomonadota bacterium]
MTKQQIVALGGGGFSMEKSPLLDDYILSLARIENPKICFMPTATGDSKQYVGRFYNRFKKMPCEATHLTLFDRKIQDLEAFIISQDIIYVGGGNTANMLAIWHVHGVDSALKKALAGGTVMAGISAGSICWFESGVTDSFGEDLAPYNCLGFLSGSNCPHYDGEAARRPAYHKFIEEGSMPSGLAADDSVGLHFVDGVLHKAVSSR